MHDFGGVDRVYDHIRSLGLYPVVELSFMPHDLASDPSKTVFEYDAIISPPKDWERWHDLVRDLTAHLVERYGDEVVEHWSFEVWNEANLEVFWSGTPSEYLQLYDVTAAAVRDVDERLRVGGPSSAAAGWVEELLAHADRSGAPVDFVSTHTYGARRWTSGRCSSGTAGPGRRSGGPSGASRPRTSTRSATRCSRGVPAPRDARRWAGSRSLSYWVVSDHFEELGRPSALLHGGFGLRTVGELRKPRWWALAMLERLGSTRRRVAGRRRRGLARRGGRGHVRLGRRVGAAVEPDARPDQGRRIRGLAREVSVEVRGLVPEATYTLRHERVDEDHSNVASAWGRLRDAARPGRPTSSGRCCARPTGSRRWSRTAR